MGAPMIAWMFGDLWQLDGSALSGYEYCFSLTFARTEVAPKLDF